MGRVEVTDSSDQLHSSLVACLSVFPSLLRLPSSIPHVEFPTHKEQFEWLHSLWSFAVQVSVKLSPMLALCFHSCMLFSLPLHISSSHVLCDLLTDEQKPNLTLF